MANNIVAIEDIPQLHPAQCSFNGDGAETSKFFIRVVNPDSYTDTLLIGSVFFHEMAKRVGYVPLEDVDKAKRSLEGQLVDVVNSLDRFSDELASMRSVVDQLEAVEKQLDALRKVVTAAGKLIKSTEQSATTNSSSSASTDKRS